MSPSYKLLCASKHSETSCFYITTVLEVDTSADSMKTNANSWMLIMLLFNSRLPHCNIMRTLQCVTVYKLTSIISYCLIEIPGRAADTLRKKQKPGHTELLNKLNSYPKTGDVNECTFNSYHWTHPSFPYSL